MKDLSTYMKGLYVSLEGLDESYKERLANIDGYQISECCGDECDCACGCDLAGGLGQDPCTCPAPQVAAQPVTVVNQFGRFNNEQEIIRELDAQPKVGTLIALHSQFGRFNFVKDVKRQHVEPLYFGHKDFNVSVSSVNRENGDMPSKESDFDNNDALYDVDTKQNKKIYKVVTDLVDTFELVNPVVQTKINGEVQVYAVKYTGTNGKENSIKSSLEEVAGILGKLDKKAEIQWSQVLDVAIDNIDDLYTFLITFVFDADKVRETIKPEKLEVA